MATLDELLSPAQAPAGQTLADLVGTTGVTEPQKQDPGYVETGLRSLARGGLGLASGVGAASEWAGDVTDSPNLRTAGRMIQDTTQKEISEGAGRLEGPAFEGTFEENPSVKRGFSAVAQAVPSLALAVGTGGLAAGGLRAAGMAAPKALAVGSGVAAGGLGVLEGAPQYIEAKEAGKSTGEASAAGAAATIGTALLEYLPISKILGVAGKGALKGGVTGALTEGLQEGTQTVWQNLVAKVGYDDSRNLATGLVESMIGGAGAGGVVGAVVGRSDAAQHTKDRAAETLIKNAFPGTEVSVEGGQAKLIRETSGGTTDLAMPLASLAKMMASGVTVDELFSAKAELKAQVDAATTDLPNMDDPDNALAFFEQSIPKEDQAAMADVFDNIRQNNLHKGMTFPQQLFNMVGGVYESRTGKKLDILGGVNEETATPAPKFARLEDGPDTLRYNVRGKDYAYAPLEGQTVDDLRAGVEGKSPAAAVNWLKKNSQLVKEVPNVQTDQVVPEPVVPQAEEVVAPVARGDEADAGGVPGEPVPATVQPEQVVAQKKARKPKGAAPSGAAPSDTALPEVETEIITQADDTPAGKNMEGEALYDRADGSRYRMRTDRADRPGGYPDFGGDLAPATDEAPKLSTGTKNKGQRPSKVKAEIEKKYGALDKVIASGKLNILRASDGLPEGVAAGSEIYSADGKTVVGAYVGGKVYLVADAIAPGEAPGVFLHEVAHRLLDQDTAFKSAKAKIVADFGKLDTQAAKDARDKVPANTPAAAVGEEGLAYFLQTQEGRKSSLWRRLVVAVRSGLRRLGFDMQYTEDDILEMFTAGARSFVETEEAAPAEVTANVTADVTADVPAPKFSLSEPKKVMAVANDALSESRKKVGEALLALASPRAKGRELYEKYAPQWLSVTSLHHIAQVFGKNVPQIKSMDRHVDDLVTTKTAIIDRAYSIHKAAEKAASDKDGSGVAKFNRAALTGTFNQMTPWSGLFEQDWVPAEGTEADRLKEAEKAWSSAGMKKSTGLDFQEAYRESADAFNALSPMEQIQLQRMVEDTAAIRQRERTNLLKRIELLSEGSPELRKSLMLQFDASFNNLKGMYLPLSRFGDFILEYTNAKGQRVLEAFPDAAQRKAVRETLAGEGVDEATVVERVKDKNAAVIAGMPQELMSQLTRSVESKFLASVDHTDELAVAAAREHAQAAVSDMNQTFFRWLPDTSAMKNSVRRKNIQGASDNMLRGYLDYIQRHAVAIAWSEVGSKIEQDIQGLANENAELRKSGLSGEGPVNLDMRVNLLNDMRARVKAIRTTNVGGLWSGISKLNTGYFMTSPSAFFVQMTQIPTLTLPKLGAMFGWGKSSKALAVAGREAFSKKFSAEAMLADPIVNALYDDIRTTVNEANRREGQALGDPMFSPAQIQVKMRKLSDYQLQLLTLREAMDRNLLDISAAHEAFELTRGGDPDSKMSRLFRTVMLPMQHGELASRKTAVLATLDLALKSGKGLFGKQNQDGTYAPGAIDDIHEVVKGTLFSYAKEDMGAATQGGAIRTILQFQKFRVFTGLRIARLFLESVKGIPSAERAAARKEFVGIMGMSTLIGGVKGTIYAAPIMAIANLLFGWDDDDKPYSAELDFTNWMEETFGKTAGDAIAHGPLTLMGTNISRRVGLGDIYGSQAEPPPGLHGAALATWWAGSLLGPTFSVAQGWFKGYDQMMNKGNYMRGLEDASPKPVKDALKAFRFATEGVKTGDGRKLLSDDEIGVDELLTTFLGFQSDEVARAQAANAALGKMSTAISERRGRLIRDAAEAILSEDGDIEGAIAAVTKHAQKMPRYAITASEIKGAIAKRIKGEFGVTGKRELGVAQDYEIDVLGGGE